MNKNIHLSGNVYKIIDVIENISVADSFVTSTNKIGEGAGEAKLYLGRNEEQIIENLYTRADSYLLLYN